MQMTLSHSNVYDIGCFLSIGCQHWSLCYPYNSWQGHAVASQEIVKSILSRQRNGIMRKTELYTNSPSFLFDYNRPFCWLCNLSVRPITLKVTNNKSYEVTDICQQQIIASNHHNSINSHINIRLFYSINLPTQNICCPTFCHCRQLHLSKQ